VLQPPHRFERLDPPEIAALKRLKNDQPDLAPAVEFQVEVLTLQRRLQGRLSTPWSVRADEWLTERLASGRPVLQVDDVAFDWMELRLLFRQLADVMIRYEAIEAVDHAALLGLARASHPTADEVAAWFEYRASRAGSGEVWQSPHGETFTQVLELSARPFVERAAESLRARIDLANWERPYCPVCGASPEMASFNARGDRFLHCGSCATAWSFSADVCPSCGNDDRRRLPSFASPDGRYQLLACDVCRKYVKAFDGRRADRPLMLAVDTIATLPLDAAAMNRGYTA
jgi:formate dehydrogenase maturation protein FdhE